MQTRLERLKAVLNTAFQPSQLEVVDDSARHAGHAGAAAGGETHYSITMTALAFAGQSRVARSRAVHDVMAAEFRDGLHAVSLTLRSPADAPSK